MLEAALALAQVVLPGEVGAVGEPQAQGVAVGLAHDVAAFQNVVQSLLAHAAVRVAQRAEAVFVVLKHVGVDGADAHALLRGVLAHGCVVAVLRLVPGDVDGDGGGDAGHLVYHSGVVHLLAGGHRCAGPGNALKRVPLLA